MKTSILTDTQREELSEYLRNLTDYQILFLTPYQIKALEQRKRSDDNKRKKYLEELRKEEEAHNRLDERNLERDIKALRDENLRKEELRKEEKNRFDSHYYSNKTNESFDSTHYRNKTKRVDKECTSPLERDWKMEEENSRIQRLNDAIEKSL